VFLPATAGNDAIQMDPERVAMASSFTRVRAQGDACISATYERVFGTAPTVRALFPADMTEQRKKLMATLAIVVNGLDNMDSILPAAGALAKRHVSYGAQASHYPVVGEALLWTLEKGLGRSWTPEVAAAWTSAYETLSGFMISAAQSEEPAA